jgi:hypothetical protein
MALFVAPRFLKQIRHLQNRRRESMTTQQWRYKALVIRELALSEAKMNAEGEKGWELVSVCMEGATARAYFKKAFDPHEELHAPEHDTALVGSHA